MTWSLDPQCLSNMQWRLPSFIRKWTDKTTWKIEKTILKKVHHLFLFILFLFLLLQLLAWRNERIYIYASIHTIIKRVGYYLCFLLFFPLLPLIFQFLTGISSSFQFFYLPSLFTFMLQWTVRLFHIMCHGIWSILDYTGR